jgi:glucose-1-phosphate cytidylyltransferase
MKVAILAGGVGTRLVEETEIKPKPMVEIGGQPILWHIMKHYEHHGFKDFVIALGYRGEYIKRYMMEYCSLASSMTVNLASGEVEHHDGAHRPDWRVSLVDTGHRHAHRWTDQATRPVPGQRDVHAHLGRRRVER